MFLFDEINKSYKRLGYRKGSGYLHSEVLCMQPVNHFLDAQRLINIHRVRTNDAQQPH
jgi:hypothetical protein